MFIEAYRKIRRSEGKPFCLTGTGNCFANSRTYILGVGFIGLKKLHNIAIENDTAVLRQQF